MIYWDPNPDLFIIPVLNWPIKWYGLFFALGFALGFPLFKNLLVRYFQERPEFHKESLENLKKIALRITDKLTVYMVIATIVGARVGHFLFYEKPSDYLRDPLEILRIREGGLASHGAALAILLALWLFSRWTKTFDRELGWLRLLDFICIPTALAAGFIRIGNFIGQEILGTKTSLPWAVVFGHPADLSFPTPRHPVQLYEAFFYFAVFFLLWRLSYKPKLLLAPGWLIGLFLLLIFAFRFFIEFFKEEQSRLMNLAGVLTMGQWLSVPFILLGAFLLYRSRRYKRSQ